MVRRAMLDAEALTEKKHAGQCGRHSSNGVARYLYCSVLHHTWSISFPSALDVKSEDTRYTFTGQPHDALRDKGIRTFMVNEGLSGGDEIVPKLVEAIHDSAAAVAIISKKHADSRLCLEELARLFECRKLVIPVFYRVNPSHVQRQNGSFGDAFQILILDNGDESIKRWRPALEMAGHRSGYVLDTDSD